MREAPSLANRSLSAEPMRLAAAWPADRRLFMLHSGRLHERWARWSMLAEPVASYRFDGRSTLTGPAADALDISFSHDPLRDLDRLLEATRLSRLAADVMALPFAGGWIGYLSYDLGRLIEPVAQHRAGPAPDRPWPLIELAWCPAALVYDGVNRSWHDVGHVEGLDDLDKRLASLPDDPAPAFRVGPLHSSFDPDDYVAAVARTVELIAAGDVFQANITQRLTAAFAGNPRGLFQASMRTGSPWYGAYLEFDAEPASPSRRLVSLSPELFLDLDPASRRVVTRPIKGTRPVKSPADELRASTKDEAELNMIIDLMRNDLGRVCEFGSVRVAEPRAIETHPTVHHGVGEIHGTLRDGVTTGGLLAATFPGGSITGAPKIRAMQIIDELEPVRRGPYCGAVGFFGDDGRIRLNIAIRTMLLTGMIDRMRGFRGVLDYGAGGGIVADSDPLGEYRESLDKVAVLREAIAGGLGRRPARA